MHTTIPDTIDNAQDVIDSRDVIARIEWLESELATTYDDDNAAPAVSPGCRDWVKDAAEDNDHPMQEEAQELLSLWALAEQAEGYVSDWQHGAALIADSYFEDYARQFAEDIGAIPDDAAWPCTCIDWEQAARELQMDYTSVEFDGVTYWVR